MKRTFVAIKFKVTDSFEKSLDKLQYEFINEKIKWIDTGNYHLTLYFLGSTDKGKIQIIAQELRKACIQFPEFNVCGKSLNVFRSVYKPRVFFVGIEKSDKLIKLKEKVEKILSEFGYIPETREFRPHITIGRTKRIKDINNLKQVIKKYRNEFVIDINVKSIIFYESKLTDNGAVYNVLSEINF